MVQTGKQFLFVSDFDQTLSFNDSGLVLSKLIGVSAFRRTSERALRYPPCAAGRGTRISAAA